MCFTPAGQACSPNGDHDLVRHARGPRLHPQLALLLGVNPRRASGTCDYRTDDHAEHTRSGKGLCLVIGERLMGCSPGAPPPRGDARDLTCQRVPQEPTRVLICLHQQ